MAIKAQTQADLLTAIKIFTESYLPVLHRVYWQYRVHHHPEYLRLPIEAHQSLRRYRS